MRKEKKKKKRFLGKKKKKKKKSPLTSSTIDHNRADAADPGAFTTKPALIPLPERCMPRASTSLGSARPPAWSTTVESEIKQ